MPANGQGNARRISLRSLRRRLRNSPTERQKGHWFCAAGWLARDEPCFPGKTDWLGIDVSGRRPSSSQRAPSLLTGRGKTTEQWVSGTDLSHHTPQLHAG